MLLTTILAVVFILTMALSFAYFTSSANANGVAFSFAKLQTQIAMNGSTFTNNGTISLGTQNLSQGSKVLTNVKVKTVEDSTPSYIRVRVDFKATSGATGDNLTKAQNMSVALNSLERATPYSTAIETNYKWIYKEGYYYLVGSDGKLLNATANIEYTLFDATHTILCPDLQGLRLADNTTLENVAINVVCEAVQSTNLAVSNNSVEDLHTKLKENKIFEENVVGDYFVKFEANGGADVLSQVVKADTKITLPTVGETEVQWYNGETLVNKSGESYKVTSDLTLIAHYGTDNNVFYVYFDLDGATTGDAPSMEKIEYQAGQTKTINISTNISKVGYTFSKWKVKGGNTEFEVTNNTIQIPTDLTAQGTAVTIIPVWESVAYTITFDVGNDSNLTGQLSKVEGIKNNNDGTYSLTYTINTSINLPTLTNADTQYSFMGWKVAEENATYVWQLADIIKAGQTATGLYGDVVVKPLWGIEQIIKYEHSTIEKTYGDEDFINPITSIGASGVTFTYASSNTNIATVDGNGKVHIIKVGTATITATYGTNLSISYELTVNARDINNVIVTNYEDTYTETGSAITPNVKLQDTTKGFLIANTDYTISYANNTSAGTARITLTGKGNYTGIRTIEFTIAESKDLSKLDLEITVSTKMYDASNNVPNVTIKNKSTGKGLVSGADFLVSTTDINVTDNATVTIQGIGAYSGRVTATYKIVKNNSLKIDGITLSSDTKYQDKKTDVTSLLNTSGAKLANVPTNDIGNLQIESSTIKGTVSGVLGEFTTITITATIKDISTGQDVLQNYDITNNTITTKVSLTVKIYRPKVTFEVGVAEGNFASGALTGLYGEYGTKDLYNANVGGTVAYAPTFNPTNSTNYTFNGYWDSATGGNQKVDKDGKLIENFTITTSPVIWYAQVKSKLNEIYSETWTYTRGTFSQTMTANAQMASYGTFTESSSGEFIQFGWYPQTIKASGVTITTTTKKFAGWDCYVGSDSCLYVKVASPTPYSSGNSSTYSDGTACSTTTELYFKLERIVWQILSDTSGNRLLYSVKELTSMPYYESTSSRTISGTTIYANNYKYSYVRAYLNGLDTYGTSGTVNANTSKYCYKDKGLLQQAFTTDQLKLINETTVNNAKETTSTDSDGNNKYTCENTTDKIFLLSYKDLNSTYSSAVKNGSSSATRIKYPTDYAGAMGAVRNNSTSKLYGGYYWLRSPGSAYSYSAWYVLYDGPMGNYSVLGFEFGVVPALFLNI